jgi:AcrR family transcriptional regulator
VRTHGWGGDPPGSDDEAVSRILAATRESIDRKGPAASLADVAGSLQVTRQTIYRYFPSTEALLQQTALDATEDFMNRLAARVDHVTDPGEAVVELVASTLEALPTEPYIGILVSAPRVGTFAWGFTSPLAMRFGRLMLGRLHVDWAALGLTGPMFEEFVEQMLRTMQSLVIDPGTPPRQGRPLRDYLHRWLWAPATMAGHQAQLSRTGRRTAAKATGSVTKPV